MPLQIKHNSLTETVFAPSGGNVTFTTTGLVNTGARISNVWDRGPGPQPALYFVEMATNRSTAGDSGAAVEAWIATSMDNVAWDGGVTVGDATIPAGPAATIWYNLTPLCNARRVTTSSPHEATVYIEIYARYVALLWLNFSGGTLDAVAANHYTRFKPIPAEIS